MASAAIALRKTRHVENLRRRRWARGQRAMVSAAPLGAKPAPSPATSVNLKPGQEVIFPIAIANGNVTLGAARASRAGAAQPKEGEITVSFVRRGLSPYAELEVSGKTPEPVDFVATGLIGDIRIDEVVVCGRLDAPASNRIASGSWRVLLSRFSVRQTGQESGMTKEGLQCPR
jgi:hypothetical protein